MSVSVSQLSFTGGEFAPSLFGRVDLAKYATGLRTLKNALCHPHGCVSNRGGTAFVGFVKDASKTTRLVPFQFSVTDTYMLEFGHQYIRFYRAGGRIVETGKGITGATQASPVVITSAGHSYANGDWVFISDVSGMTQLNGKYYKVADQTADTFALHDIDGTPIDGTGYQAYTSGGKCEKIHEITTPYADTDLARLAFCQSADTLFLTHPSHAPQKLTRTGHTSWTLSEITFGAGIAAPEGFTKTLSGSGRTFAVTAVSASGEESTVSSSATGGNGSVFAWDAVAGAQSYNIYEQKNGLYRYLGTAGGDAKQAAITGATQASPVQITAPGHRFENNDRVYISGVVGMTQLNGNTYTVAGVSGDTFTLSGIDGTGFTAYVSGGLVNSTPTRRFTVEADIEADMSDTAPQARTPFAGANNYPGVSCFHEQRWVAARTDSRPQDIWGSVTGSFANMNVSLPGSPDDAWNFTLNSQQVNEIRWLVPLDTLLVGTSGGEFCMSAGTTEDAISATSVDIKKQSNWGSAHMQPLVIGNSVLFLERSASVVRDLTYSFEVDGYAGSNLSILSNHLFDGFTITGWCYSQYPDSVVWCVRSDGALLGMTYFREHQVWGWHRHETAGHFKAVASLPDGQVYAIVERTLNGAKRGCVELFRHRLPPDSDGHHDVRDAYFVDCGLSYDKPVAITAATAANPVVITTAANHGLSDGDTVLILRVKGMTELNGNNYTVADSTATTFSLKTTATTPVAVDGRKYGPYTSGGQVRKEVATIAGLDHLEGEAVAVLADGNVVSDLTVSGGAITLPQKAAIVHAGLGYTTELETLDFDYQTDTGTVQDKIRHIHSAVLTVENSRGFFVGPSEDRLNEKVLEDTRETFKLFSGDALIYTAAGAQREGRLSVRNEKPTPFTILSITARMTHGDS